MEFKRILLPVDFSEPSKAAAHAGISLAGRFNPEVTLLHVWEMPSYISYYPMVPSLDAHVPLSKTAQEEAEKKMASFLEEVQADLEEVMKDHNFCSLQTRCEPGHPGDTIVRIAKEEDFDAIIMGTHGRNAMARLVMGSVTTRVLHHAPCPVLAIPPAKKK